MFGLLAVTAWAGIVEVAAGVTVILGAVKLAIETARAAADARRETFRAE